MSSTVKVRRVLPGRAALVVAVLVCLGMVTAPSALADAAPAFAVSSLATPTNFKPGDADGTYSYDIRVANIGSASSDGSPITIKDSLPPGLEVVGDPEFELRFVHDVADGPEEFDFGSEFCDTTESGGAATVTCVIPEEVPGDEDEPSVLYPLEEFRIVINVFTLSTVAEGTVLQNQVSVEGGGAASASGTSENLASSDPAGRGFSYYRAQSLDEEGNPFFKAGDHPFQWFSTFALNTNPAPEGANIAFVPAGGDVKDIKVELPAGLIGNPTAAELCSAEDFNTVHSEFIGTPATDISFYNQNECPDSSVIGVVNLQNVEGEGLMYPVPLYNLVPAPGLPAQFGFQYANLPFYIDGEVRNESDYGINGVLHNVSQAKRVTAAAVFIWGTPASGAHDPVRGSCLVPVVPRFRLSRGDCAAGLPDVKPFFRLPTSCSSPLDTSMAFTNWSDPAASPISAKASGQTPDGCGEVPFDPEFAARPTTAVSDSPSGLTANLHIPQDEVPEQPGQSDLKDIEVSLPEGLVINPSGANGLAGCSPAEIDLHGEGPAQCPDASRIGKVEIETPLLEHLRPGPFVDHPLSGSVFVATPYDNPFGSLLAIYVAVHDPVSGVIVKLPGKVDADPLSGRLTTTFQNNPQLPFEDFRLNFFGGSYAALRSPATCGEYATNATLIPWSGGPPVPSTNSYGITQAPGGGACPTNAGDLPFGPTFKAGSAVPEAGKYSPFVINLQRADGSQELSSLTVSPPLGLVANFSGIPYCPEAAIAAAASKPGKEEIANSSCPPASLVGSIDVGAGAGPSPYFTGGKVYLAGPYKGAPLSLAIITPATAGPYDLGTVVVRTALNVDPESTRVTAVADPIPQVLKGIPLDVRTISVKLDRGRFMLNPTSCEPLSLSGEATSTLGKVAPLTDHFQLEKCRRLKFAPQVALRLRGGTKRTDNPSLRAIVTFPKKGSFANTARASVALPRSEFLEQSHINTICTRVQFAADNCPRGSIYGYAKAITPIFDKPLKGPVYLRSSDNPLPDLVADLRGQVRVALVGRIDSAKNGGMRSTFDSVPDAPVSKFIITLKGGKKGLLVNSRNICAQTYRATARFTAHNGLTANSSPALKASCRRHKSSK
jgi:hypothetical protein